MTFEFPDEAGPDDLLGRAGKSGARFGLLQWENALLLLVAAVIAGMVAFLLWPQPKAVVTLQAIGASERTAYVMNLPADEPALAANPNAERPTVRSRKHHSARSGKPAKPPVLNLNTASGAQLQLLPGIGPKMAQRIIDYRKAHGPFAEISQVMDVNGIGPKKFEKMKPYLKL